MLRDRPLASARNRKVTGDELDTLKRELAQIERALYRQTLRLEEHDDPTHPVVAMASRRIEELSARREAVTEAITTREAKRPTDLHPDVIEAMLDAVPDLRPTLVSADPQELADLFDAFDVTAEYDKANDRLKVAATVLFANSYPPPNKTDRHEGARGILT